MSTTDCVVPQAEPGQLMALTERLVTDVVDGKANAGAVIVELPCHPLWYPVLCHLRSHGLIGDALWDWVEDPYGGDIWRFMSDQIVEMTKPGLPGGKVMQANLAMPPHPGAGPVTTPIDSLISDVMDNNPRAGRMIGEVAHHPLWSLLLWHLRAHGLIGSALWRTIQDQYNSNAWRFARDQSANMTRRGDDCQGGTRR